jgi:hypothetical protein
MSNDFESLGFQKYYESLSSEHKKQLFGDKIPSFQIDTTLWNSDFFKIYRDTYDKKLLDLQDSGITTSAGTCPFCGSDKTRAERKQTAHENISSIIYCLNCSRTHKR